MAMLLCGVLLASCAASTVRIETGAAPPAPQVLSAELIVPKGAGPHPAVIVAHGCSGITPSQRNWASRIADWGYATLLLDSFGPRGRGSICTDAASITGRDRAGDVGAAVRWLRQRPEIDPARIGLVGFSHGGWTAMWTAHEGWPARTGNPPLRAAVAFYPWCDATSDALAKGPLLVLIGEADDWTPAERCRQSQAAIGARADIAFVYYAGARHGFDVPGLNVQVQGLDASGVKSRWLLHDPDAARDSERRVKAWLAQYLQP
jgi:dienelactone hydrolase